MAWKVNAQMQPGTVTQDLINVTTSSPDIASLGKFGNIPVSYSTGIPSISIPIFEINVPGIRIPVSLDYHGGGIKVSENAPSTGLGWSLTGIGTVSRQIVGIQDEYNNSGLFYSPDPDSVANNPSLFYQYLFNVQRGLADNEPDIFSYNINGGSGNFSFRRDRSILQVPFTANKISYNGLDFTITDPEGVVYIFDVKTFTSSSTASIINNAPVSWRLSKMVAPNSVDTIYFSYETACNPSFQKIENFSHFLGYSVSCTYNNTGAVYQNYPQYSYTTQTVNEAYPREIKWRGGKIVFINNCDRQDVSGSAMRLSEVQVYSNLNGNYKLIKKTTLHHSYFNSTGTEFAFVNDTTADKKKRLRLDSVRFMPVAGSYPPQVYTITYDTTKMAPKESEAMDRWGYNNGKFANATLVPKSNALFLGNYVEVGGADREPDSAYMLACSIKSITYPTKGKTVFEFAPRYFYSKEKQTQNLYAQAYCAGGVRSADTVFFTVTANDQFFKLTYNLPAIQNIMPQPSSNPIVSLYDVTAGSTFYSNAVVGQYVSTGISVNNLDLALTAGHTYRLVCNTYTTSSSYSGIANVSWTRNLGDSLIRKIGGGLMVKSITNYDLNGRFLTREKYDYSGDNMLTDAYYQNVNVESVIPRGGQGQFCEYIEAGLEPGYSFIFHGNSVLPVSEAGGSPVLYKNVTKYELDSLGNDNGKTVYTYNIYNDYQSTPDFSNSYGPVTTFSNRGFYLISQSWKNNYLSSVSEFRRTATGYVPSHTKAYNYKPYRENNVLRLKVKNKYMTLCCQDQNMTATYAAHDFALNLVPQPTGAMLLESESDTTWDYAGNKTYFSSKYEYSDTSHIFQTMKRYAGSNGDQLKEQNFYPRDLAASNNVYQKMLTRNMIAPVVKQVKYRNNIQMNLEQANYKDWNNNAALLLPQTEHQQVYTYPVDTMLRFNKYDIYGNILEQQKDSDVNTSYIWGYDTLYPIATVTNANQAEIAYTSFEPDAIGNWNIASTIRDTTQSATGKQAYSLSSGNITKSGLNSSKTYYISYWSKSGSASISGTTAVLLMSRNGWNCYEHKLSGYTTATVYGNVVIDELRLFPADAQMKTFSYEPLVGITHLCDENNRIVYYEYDGFQRLMLIRDMDKNIVKTINYGFKQ